MCSQLPTPAFHFFIIFSFQFVFFAFLFVTVCPVHCLGVFINITSISEGFSMGSPFFSVLHRFYVLFYFELKWKRICKRSKIFKLSQNVFTPFSDVWLRFFTYSSFNIIFEGIHCFQGVSLHMKKGVNFGVDYYWKNILARIIVI